VVLTEDTCLKIVLTIQLAIFGVIGLDTIGLQIPIIRQLIGFIYLSFVPGILILKILKLHKLGTIETLLYTVGLSIATLMFVGLFMNTIYPLFGVSGPISLVPLIITISAVVLVLCILSYLRDKDFSNPNFIDVNDILSTPALFLCLIPFLSIFGAYLVNFHQNNIVLMFLIVIIALIALLIGFDKFIPKNLYPLTVFIIAISLAYHRSLITMYVWGWDIHYELYLCNLVEMNSIWDPTMFGNCNAMLSLVMLAPIYSIISNMDIIWVFKIIYPLLFSLVPLGLYRVFQKQTDNKSAFLSCFFFVSLFSFYGEILGLARQEIAELFLVLLILLMINKDMAKIKSSFLFIVFGISLVVSHYGLSYIYMFCLISAWLILVFMDISVILSDNFHSKFSRYKNEEFPCNPLVLNTKDRTISSTFVLLFIVFALTWYMYVTSSSTFNSIIYIGDHVASSISTDFLNPKAAEGLGIILRETVSPLHSIGTKYIHLITQFFILVGVISLLLKRKETKFEGEYASFSIVNIVICFAAIAVPYFASSLNTTRLFHITLVILAPFCIIGEITIFKVLNRVFKTSWTDQSAIKILSVFLVIFLLFNTGFVFEVAKDHPRAVTLSQNWIKEHGDKKAIAGSHASYVPEQNVVSLRWLSETINKEDIKIYAGYYHHAQIVGYGMIPFGCIYGLSNMSKIRRGMYVYLGYLNVVEGIVVSTEGSYYNTTEIYPLLNTTNEIYTNGGSEIYHYE